MRLSSIKVASPTERALAYLSIFDGQHATIESLSKALNVDAEKLFNDKPAATHLTSSYAKGWSAVMTCSRQHNLETNFPNAIGDLDFWLGAADGQICKQRLEQPEFTEIDEPEEDVPGMGM